MLRYPDEPFDLPALLAGAMTGFRAQVCHRWSVDAIVSLHTSRAISRR
jgi:hypothetical protein